MTTLRHRKHIIFDTDFLSTERWCFLYTTMPRRKNSFLTFLNFVRSHDFRCAILLISTVAPFLLLASFLSTFVLDGQTSHETVAAVGKPHVYRKTAATSFNVTVTSSQTNITLTLLGKCRAPFTYAGTDTRISLLTHFDVIGIPAKKYSPPVMNWAKVLLLQSLHTICANTSSWLVYSDVDAYIVSRKRTASRLAKLSKRVHFAFMNGAWFINIGFLAFRVSPEARRLMDAWGSKYIHPPKTFIDARIFARRVVLKKRSQCVDRPNGFLGWHMKGNAKWKAALANIGRTFADGWGHLVATLTTITFLLMLFACAYAHRERTENRRVIHKSTYQRVLFRWCTGIERIALFLTNPLVVLFIVSVYACVHGTLPMGIRKNGKQISIQSLSHVLFDGRVMIDKRRLCAYGEAYICSENGGLRHLLWTALLSSEDASKLAFTFTALIEWSGVLWFYTAAVAFRIAFVIGLWWSRKRWFKTRT